MSGTGPTRLGTAKPSKTENLFKGLSTLRADERKRQAEAEPKAVDPAMQAYLKNRYLEGGSAEPPITSEYAEPKRKKKKKLKTGAGAEAAALRIVDQDVSGFGSRKPPESFSEEEEDEEYQAVVANPEEAKALAQQIEKSRNFYAKQQDGSGWVSVEEQRRRDAELERAQGRNQDMDEDQEPPRRPGQRRGEGGCRGGASAGCWG